MIVNPHFSSAPSPFNVTNFGNPVIVFNDFVNVGLSIGRELVSGLSYLVA
jgi:hypothetical protein